MYLRHFGLTHPPLGKATTGELWDDGPLARLKERFLWLLEAPGIGLLTGEPGTGVRFEIHVPQEQYRILS